MVNDFSSGFGIGVRLFTGIISHCPDCSRLTRSHTLASIGCVQVLASALRALKLKNMEGQSDITHTRSYAIVVFLFWGKGVLG